MRLGKRSLAKSYFFFWGISSKISGAQTYIPVLARFENISPGAGFSLNLLIWKSASISAIPYSPGSSMLISPMDTGAGCLACSR
ncbi:MAG: hypothetical protein A4E40_00635 [Methanoregulaceae archaeon PtaU1.Bin059]|nr:MAG: hypothetical protein A4E40_00635 [Methanoregulaceae archaeon PtaU1.Bin059]